MFCSWIPTTRRLRLPHTTLRLSSNLSEEGFRSACTRMVDFRCWTTTGCEYLYLWLDPLPCTFERLDESRESYEASEALLEAGHAQR